MPEPLDTPSLVRTACLSCGTPIERRYCPECGEHRIDRSDYSLLAFLRSAFREFTNLDSTIYRSFKALLFKPGLLTAEYIAGRRKPYVGPVRLFLICNVLFFLAQSVTGLNTFTTPLWAHLNASFHSSIAGPLVADEIMARGMTYDQYARLFNATAEVQAKSLVIILVPMYATLLGILYLLSRRYFVEHLVFSLHVIAFVLLVSILSGAGYMVGLESVIDNVDGVMSLLVMLVIFTYVFAGLRRTYGSSKLAATVGSFALALGMALIIFAYRLILFFTTYLTI